MNNWAINIRISSYKIRIHLHGYNWCQSEAAKLDFQRFLTSFASVLVAVTQTGLRSFSLNIYLEIKPHTCFSLLLIQLSFSLKVLTVININKQTLTDWDRVMLNWMSAELMKQFLKLPVWINHSPSTWEEPLFCVSLQLEGLHEWWRNHHKGNTQSICSDV